MFEWMNRKLRGRGAEERLRARSRERARIDVEWQGWRRLVLAKRSTRSSSGEPADSPGSQERGALMAVRRAWLSSRRADEDGDLQDLPHAWPVTRDHLRLLARQLERAARVEPPAGTAASVSEPAGPAPHS